jgi:hypothetical protein
MHRSIAAVLASIAAACRGGGAPPRSTVATADGAFLADAALHVFQVDPVDSAVVASGFAAWNWYDFSDDGKWLAWWQEASSAKQTIQIVPATGRLPVSVVDAEYPQAWWAPGAARLAFLRIPDLTRNAPELWVVAPGEPAVRITSALAPSDTKLCGVAQAFSPDATQIAFLEDTAGNGEIRREPQISWRRPGRHGFEADCSRLVRDAATRLAFRPRRGRRRGEERVLVRRGAAASRVLPLPLRLIAAADGGLGDHSERPEVADAFLVDLVPGLLLGALEVRLAAQAAALLALIGAGAAHRSRARSLAGEIGVHPAVVHPAVTAVQHLPPDVLRLPRVLLLVGRLLRPAGSARRRRTRLLRVHVHALVAQLAFHSRRAAALVPFVPVLRHRVRLLRRPSNVGSGRAGANARSDVRSPARRPGGVVVNEVAMP